MFKTIRRCDRNTKIIGNRLVIGKTILHYKILEKLGEGGMGVVYKAESTKLDRTVSLKFLPRQIASNEEERMRFEVEAKAAAALHHPNIATIFAIEEAEGELFIVMEYIEGQELEKLPIADGQLAIAKVSTFHVSHLPFALPFAF